MPISDLAQSIAIQIPDDADIPIEQHVLDGIQDLCRETLCLTEALSTTAVQSKNTYALPIITTNARVINFINTKWDGKLIDRTNETFKDRHNISWRTDRGVPLATIYNGGTTATLDRIPTTTEVGTTIDFLVAIEPTNVLAEIPEKIEKRHKHVISDYVKWRVYDMPKFLNVQLSDRYEKKYEKGKAKLKREVSLAYGKDEQTKADSFLAG